MNTTREFNNGIKVSAIQTGTVAVKEEHFKYSGLGILRVPKILFGKKWMKEMPIWTWVIETPTGNYLIDTGETADFFNPLHLSNKADNYVNRKILRINISREQEIDQQLKEIGLSSGNIDVVILTHMHIDHIDGVKYFPHSKFLVSKLDREKPYGIPLSVLPTWFKSEKIDYRKSDYGFTGGFKISNELEIIATPGHTLGHQSVMLSVDNCKIIFAGDMTFNEHQLKNNIVGGINMQISKSKESIKQMQQFSRENNLIYLPSHDYESGSRLQNLTITKC
jgi:N-acyl homoserine lactone hydrolase